MGKPSFRFRRVGVGLATALAGFICFSCTCPGEVAVTRDSSRLDCDQGRAGAFGINVGNLSWDALLQDNVLAALTQSGVGWIRINMYWGFTEHTRGQVDWRPTDAALSRLQRANIKALVTINGPTPCWALQDPRNCSSPQWAPENVTDWVQYVTAVVSRYRDRVHYWEIWNEPDLIHSMDVGDSNRRLNIYRDQILVPGAQAVHRADPNAKVIGPVFAAIPSGHTEMGSDLDRAFAQVMSGSGAHLVDIVSFHAYYPEDINEKAIAFRIAMRKVGMGGKPIWITETGLPPDKLGIAAEVRGTAYGESRQAAFVTDAIKVLATGNAQKVFWFALTDSQVSGVHTNHYGLVNNSDYRSYNWKPRPAYITLQNVIRSTCSK